LQTQANLRKAINPNLSLLSCLTMYVFR